MNIRFNDRETKIIQCIKDITGITPTIVQEIERRQASDTRSFRISNILLLSSSFHFFQLEEEGRLRSLFSDQLIVNGQNGAPSITHVETGIECLEELKKNQYDLLILFDSLEEFDILALTKKIRATSEIPIVVLGNNIADLVKLRDSDLNRTITKFFTWNGDGKIILTIVQLLEDSINIASDPSLAAHRRCILLIEDSIQEYSTYLLLVYEQLWGSLERAMQDAMNEEHRMLLARNRPFVLHATDFDTGKAMAETQKHNLLCLITDNQENPTKKKTAQVGLELAMNVHQENPMLPILLQSSEPLTVSMKLPDAVRFVSKNDSNLQLVVHEFLQEALGPQEIIVRDDQGSEVAIIKTFKEFEDAVLLLKEPVLQGTAKRYAFSAWLRGRGEYDLAQKIHGIEDGYSDSGDLRKRFIDALEEHKYSLTQAAVTSFERTRTASHLEITRIGKGALGGKARGLSFLAKLLSKYLSDDMFPNLRIAIPRTIVLSTEVFDAFMKQNNLNDPRLYSLPDERIALKFMTANLPATVLGDLRAFIRVTRQPLVVRSSGILEDSLMQPFAGIYDSILMPNESWETDFRFQEVCNAIKYVYASTYFEKARTYIKSTPKKLGDEKMAVIIQEVVGKKHGQYFYPAISGVAKSYNYYPSGGCKQEDGIVYLALGLGKAIVDGGSSFCFCPSQPTIPMFGTPKDFMKYSQRTFYALNLKSVYRIVGKNEETALIALDKEVAKEQGMLEKLASTYLIRDDALVPGVSEEGSIVINFAPIIEYEELPLAKALNLLLRISEIALGYPVEIEFAVNLGASAAEKTDLVILQIRSMVPPGKTHDFVIEGYNPATDVCYSENALGNGIIGPLQHIVYVKSTFDMTNSARTVLDLRALNSKLLAEGTPYLLVGPGRWGSADPWLGIPVIWSDIAGAKAIIETPFKERSIDPSQGSHFFHDLISSQVGYLITKAGTGNIDDHWLDTLHVVEDLPEVRHVKTPYELIVKIDGKHGRAVIQKGKKINNGT
ncbi:MAG TPA: PEP/pyruvate-binding domain-containing protein [Candidatus Thermoplasmatota archaeon]|nr:PEP/pyruvate-binding domain-containing protein [Candidatus Thermoplasmatota archaeon]